MAKKKKERDHIPFAPEKPIGEWLREAAQKERRSINGFLELLCLERQEKERSKVA